jgi:hypothetical protein
MPAGRYSSPVDLAPPLWLAGSAEAAGAARRYVRQALTAAGRPELLAAAELGVSELVTNACLHARTALTVRIAGERSGPVRIRVSDGSPIVPVQRRRSRLAGTGRGLLLVAAAGRWGVEDEAAGGKTVWFEPAEEIQELAAAGGPWLELGDVSGAPW